MAFVRVSGADMAVYLPAIPAAAGPVELIDNGVWRAR